MANCKNVFLPEYSVPAPVQSYIDENGKVLEGVFFLTFNFILFFWEHICVNSSTCFSGVMPWEKHAPAVFLTGNNISRTETKYTHTFLFLRKKRD